MPVSIQLLSRFPLLQPLGSDALEPLSRAMNLREFARRGIVIAKDNSLLGLGF